MLTRAVAADLADVGPAVAWADRIMADAGVPADLRGDIQVCVEEALANLILHGRAAQSGKGIVLSAGCEDAEPTVVIRDRCAPFDPAAAPPLPLPSLADGRIGGNGLRLIRGLSKGLSYESVAGANTLVMTFAPQASCAAAGPPDRSPRGEPAIEALRRVPAFASASEAALDRLLAAGRRVEFAAGERLLTQAEPSVFALVLLSGAVDVVHDSLRGPTAVGRIPAPALVGEIGALAGLPRTASMVAREPVTALRVEREALLDLSRHAPDMLVSVVGSLGRQLQHMNDALGLFGGGLAALGRDELDLTILDELNNPSGELANFALAFGQLAERIAAERRSRGEMMSAALIQRAMLPAALGEIVPGDRCDVFGDMQPARDVGGDFYDVIRLDEDRIALAVGDVCGKGVPASLFMSVTVTTLRLAAKQFASPPEMIEHVNTMLCAQNAASMFSTLFYGVLDLSSGTLEYVNCAHCPAYLIGTGAPPTELLTGPGAPLGVIPGRRWPSHTVRLGPGQGVFLYTDGVTEAVAPDGQEYGDGRLAGLLERHADEPAEALVRACMADVERFAGGGEPFDDVTCLVARMS